MKTASRLTLLLRDLEQTNGSMSFATSLRVSSVKVIEFLHIPLKYLCDRPTGSCSAVWITQKGTGHVRVPRAVSRGCVPTHLHGMVEIIKQFFRPFIFGGASRASLRYKSIGTFVVPNQCTLFGHAQNRGMTFTGLLEDGANYAEGHEVTVSCPLSLHPKVTVDVRKSIIRFREHFKSSHN